MRDEGKLESNVIEFWEEVQSPLKGSVLTNIETQTCENFEEIFDIQTLDSTTKNPPTRFQTNATLLTTQRHSTHAQQRTSHTTQPAFPFPISTYLAHKQPPLTFSQTLLQLCFRNGYRLLTDSTTARDNLTQTQVFGSVLTGANRDMTVGYLRDAIQRSVPPVTNGIGVGNGSSGWYGMALPRVGLEARDVVDVYTVLEMLRMRGVVVEQGVDGYGGSYAFDGAWFISCMVSFLMSCWF